jgi:RDD family
VTLDERANAAAPHILRVATAAPLWRRFVAWLVDGAIAAAPIVLAYAVTSSGGLRTVAMSVAFIAAITIAIVNGIVLVARSGQSIARRWLGISILDSHTMLPPHVGQVILRNFIGGSTFGIGWHPFAFLPSLMVIIGPWPIINYAPAIANRRWHRGLNDRWAHTVVIDLLADPRR